MINRKVIKTALYAVLVFSLGVIPSCKNYDDDIDDLGDRISAVESEMQKLQKAIENALNSGHTVIDYQLDNGVYTITLSNGEKLPLVSSTEGTPFYQFKVEDGVWKFSKDKGNKWEKVKTIDNKDIVATEKDNIFYDKTNGYIYITGVQTSITADKEYPILALNKENKTLYVYIGGESYIMPIQGSGFSGISSIIYQKQYVSEADEYMEATTIENASGVILASVPATAYFKILPKEIDLTDAILECTDIHALKTRTVSPTLSVTSDLILDEKGILKVSLTPSALEDGLYYGATLEIMLDKTTSSSNYFVVKPTMRKIEAAKVFFALDKKTLADNGDNPIEVIAGGEDYDLKVLYALGYPKGKEVDSEYVSMTDLGIDAQVSYNLVGTLPAGVTMANGTIKAGASSPIGNSFEVVATYTYDGSIIATRNLKVLIVDASAASSIALSAQEDMSKVESLFKTIKEIALNYPDAVEAKLVNGTYYLGQQSGETYIKVEGVSLDVNNDNLKFKVDPKTNFTDTYSRLAVIDVAGNIVKAGTVGDEKTFYLNNVKVEYVVSVNVKTECIDTASESGSTYYKIAPKVEDGKYIINPDFSTLYDIKPIDLDITFAVDKDKQYIKDSENNNDGLLGNKWGEITWSENVFSLLGRIDSKKFNFLNQKSGAGGIKVDVSYTGADGNPVVLPTADWKIFDPVKYPYGTRNEGEFYIEGLAGLNKPEAAVTIELSFDTNNLSDITLQEALSKAFGNRTLILVSTASGYPDITYGNGVFSNDETYKDPKNGSTGIRVDGYTSSVIEMDHGKGRFKKVSGFTSGTVQKFRVFYHYYGGGTGSIAIVYFKIIEK